MTGDSRSASDPEEQWRARWDLPLRLEHRPDACDGCALHLELARELPVRALRVRAKRRLDSQADFAPRHVHGQCGHRVDLFDSTGTHTFEPLAARLARRPANRSSWYRGDSLFPGRPDGYCADYCTGTTRILLSPETKTVAPVDAGPVALKGSSTKSTADPPPGPRNTGGYSAVDGSITLTT